RPLANRREADRGVLGSSCSTTRGTAGREGCPHPGADRGGGTGRTRWLLRRRRPGDAVGVPRPRRPAPPARERPVHPPAALHLRRLPLSHRRSHVARGPDRLRLPCWRELGLIPAIVDGSNARRTLTMSSEQPAPTPPPTPTPANPRRQRRWLRLLAAFGG